MSPCVTVFDREEVPNTDNCELMTVRQWVRLCLVYVTVFDCEEVPNTDNCELMTMRQWVRLCLVYVTVFDCEEAPARATVKRWLDQNEKTSQTFWCVSQCLTDRVEVPAQNTAK